MITNANDHAFTPEPQGSDGAVGVPEPKWFVAIVNSRHEKKVAENLQETGIKSYVATQKEMKVWKNGKRKTIDRVVIPSVVFVNCTEKERRQIVSLPFIYRFMVNRSAESGTLNKPVAVIPDLQIQKLQFMLGQSDLPVNFVPSAFKVKDNVRVIRGSLKGLYGQIMENSDGTHTLTVGIELLGGAAVKIDPYDVEKID
ncbi:MAG: UpxY family transcription antiterminator [Muribaculaceae bacterium]|nr:UpxY family transcription antiterminator [Muribaculaceae bacterium]